MEKISITLKNEENKKSADYAALFFEKDTFFINSVLLLRAQHSLLSTSS